MSTDFQNTDGALPGAPLVFWDAYGLGTAASGVYVYAAEVFNGLVNLGIRPVVVGRNGPAEVFGVSQEQPVQIKAAGLLQRTMDIKAIWALTSGHRYRFLRTNVRGKHVLHGLSNFNIPFRRPSSATRLVLTVHDIIPLLRPGLVSMTSYRQLQWLLPRALNAADAVVCISEWTRRTITERFPQVAEKCQVIRNGRPEVALPVAVSASRRPQRLIGLSVARYETYKKLEKVCEILRNTKADAEFLVVTSKNGVRILSDQFEDLLRSGRLKLAHDVDADTLSRYFQECDFYIQTSELEGYCLPAAAAVAWGKPVLFQGGSGIDEVAGGPLGISIPPGAEMDAWLGALEVKLPDLLSDLGRNTNAAELHRNALPTWKDTAKSLQTLYTGLC